MIEVSNKKIQMIALNTMPYETMWNLNYLAGIRHPATTALLDPGLWRGAPGWALPGERLFAVPLCWVDQMILELASECENLCFLPPLQSGFDALALGEHLPCCCWCVPLGGPIGVPKEASFSRERARKY